MKKLYFLLLVVLMLFIGALTVSAYDFAIVDDFGNEYYHDSYDFSLPSHISPSAVKFKVSDGVTLSYEKNDTFLEINEGSPVDFSRYKTTLREKPVYLINIKVNEVEYFMFLRFASSLPSVYITTSYDLEYILKYGYKDTSSGISVVDKEGKQIYKDSVNGSEIRTRGNATEQYAKKPFQIKLSQKANLFGMGADKTWLLLANYDDQSLIRNNVMYTIGKELGIEICDFQSVDLFLNGQYYGVYLLCEKVQIDDNRVEITDLEEETDKLNESYKSYATVVTSGALIDSTILTEYRYISGVINPENITGGYLVELDNNYYSSELCYFTTENSNHYVIKSPEYASREQVEYIAKLFADMEEAIYSSDGYNKDGKHYTEYIEINSLAAAYILQEFGRNYDAGSSSIYFYKDKDVGTAFSQIVKGPLWDCDNTLGNIHKNGASNKEGYWAAYRGIWSALVKHDDFMSLVKEKYAGIYDYIFDMIDSGGYVDSQVKEIGDSIYLEQKRWGSDNYDTWPLYYDGIHYDKWQSSQVFNFVSVYSKGLNEDESTVIGYLCEHIEARANWLANEWDIDVSLRERSLKEPEIPNDGPTNPDNDQTTPDSGETTPEPPTGGGTEATPDMTPDFEEPPAIDQAAAEKKGFFEWILSIILAIIKWLGSLIKQE